MRLLLCDKCKKEIPKGEDYVKLQIVRHKGKMQFYDGYGHLCIKDFEEITGKKYEKKK